MAEISVDTSTYPKPQPPADPLTTFGKFIDIQRGQQALQSGGLTIDKQKLDLVNQRFQEMSSGLAGIANSPDFNEDKLRKFFINQVKMGRMPNEMAGQTISSFPSTQGMKPPEAAATLRQWVDEQLVHAQTVNEAIKTLHGTNKDITDGSNIYSGVEKSPMNGGGFNPSTRMPIQPPPTQPQVDNQRILPNGQPNANYLQPGIIGAAGPSGVVPVPRPRPGLPIAPPPTSGPTGPTINNGTDFNNRFTGGGAIATGAPPGVASAIGAVAEQSGKDYASALTRSKNLQADLYPAHRVLDILKEEGPQAFGVGTDQLNTLKNAMVTWFPNVDPKTVQSVANIGEAKKQLVQLARTNGNSGTNDQLAAAFEGSPNTKMTGATIESVVKSVVALRKMEQAQTLMFAKTKLPESQYSTWVAQNQNQFDPRAFGFDMMDRAKQDKLLTSMTEKDGDSKEMKSAKANAYTKFKNSLQFAHDAELIGQ